MSIRSNVKLTARSSHEIRDSLSMERLLNSVTPKESRHITPEVEETDLDEPSEVDNETPQPLAKKSSKRKQRNSNEDGGGIMKGASGADLETTAMGTSTEPLAEPPIDPKTHKPLEVLDRPWPCGYRLCNTGQTWYPRKDIGRKCSSHFFGRNKAETTSIPEDVWHFHCRKHYQRGKYGRERMDNKDVIEAEVDMIRVQLDRLRLWRPQARFAIQLTKAAVDRSHAYQDSLRRNNGNDLEAQAAVKKKFPSKGNKNREVDLFPGAVAEVFETTCSTDNAGYEEIEDVLLWTMKMVNGGRIEAMPPYEFLIRKAAAGEVETDPSTNYKRWITVCIDGAEFDDTAMSVAVVKTELPSTPSPHLPRVRKPGPSINKNHPSSTVLSDQESDSTSPSAQLATSKRPLSSTRGAAHGSGSKNKLSFADLDKLASFGSPVSGERNSESKKRAADGSESDSEGDIALPARKRRW